ncbi:MAG: PKD domain-containing protein [Acidobacteria bacterium]|nr:PKD domain-containing protein [Acidobacteriota bacterium]
MSAPASDDSKNKKPSLSLKANPTIGFAPMRSFLTAELRGGANDYEEYYCPTVEWDWGDGTRSESTADCDPYEAGKSEIKRHFAVQHVFRLGGTYAVRIRLKRKDKVLVSASTTLRIQSSIPGRD